MQVLNCIFSIFYEMSPNVNHHQMVAFLIDEALFVGLTQCWVQLVPIVVMLDNGPKPLGTCADVEKVRFVF